MSKHLPELQELLSNPLITAVSFDSLISLRLHADRSANKYLINSFESTLLRLKRFYFQITRFDVLFVRVRPAEKSNFDKGAWRFAHPRL